MHLCQELCPLRCIALLAIMVDHHLQVRGGADAVSIVRSRAGSAKDHHLHGKLQIDSTARQRLQAPMHSNTPAIICRIWERCCLPGNMTSRSLTGDYAWNDLAWDACSHLGQPVSTSSRSAPCSTVMRLLAWSCGASVYCRLSTDQVEAPLPGRVCTVAWMRPWLRIHS